MCDMACAGLVLSCRQLYEAIAAAPAGTVYTVKAQFLEIYNEELRDLLAGLDAGSVGAGPSAAGSPPGSGSPTKLRSINIRERPDGGIIVTGKQHSMRSHQHPTSSTVRLARDYLIRKGVHGMMWAMQCASRQRVGKDRAPLQRVSLLQGHMRWHIRCWLTYDMHSTTEMVCGLLGTGLHATCTVGFK